MKRSAPVWPMHVVSLFTLTALLACGGPDSQAAGTTDTADAAAACVSGPGGACGGNILGACTCADGLTCDGSGGAPVGDVGGTCQPATCVDAVLCIQGTHWDATACRCVPDRCLDTVLCIRGTHWDAAACRCVPDRCLDTVACVLGTHWDSGACRCVPNRPGSCITAADCKGILPTYCMQCPSGATACAHWACDAGQCKTAVCE